MQPPRIPEDYYDRFEKARGANASLNKACKTCKGAGLCLSLKQKGGKICIQATTFRGGGFRSAFKRAEVGNNPSHYGSAEYTN